MKVNAIFSIFLTKEKTNTQLYAIKKHPEAIVYAIEPKVVNDKGEPLYKLEVPHYKINGDREAIKTIMSNLIDDLYDDVIS